MRLFWVGVLLLSSCSCGSDRLGPPVDAPLPAAPAGRSLPDAHAPACPDLEIEILTGQWPEPQWLRVGDKSLFGGGWSSISTGRFGSASWEHCETLREISPGQQPSLLTSSHAFGGLLSEGHDCRVPDTLVGGELADFTWLEKSMPGHDLASAKAKVGWAPFSQWEDRFFFRALGIFRDGGWEQAGWPADGFFEGWAFTSIAGGDLLLAGGYEELGGALRSVDQAAVFNASGGAWRYVAKLAAPRSRHTIVSLPPGALVLGGVDDRGQPLRTAEYYEPSTARWRVFGQTPGLGNVIATVHAGHVAVIQRVEDYDVSEFGFLSLTDGSWTPRRSPRQAVASEGDATLLSHPGGDVLLVTPDAVERYNVAADRWSTCDVPSLVETIPPAGRGLAKWGPAHVTADGRVVMTRIDRERYYDFEP